MRVGLVLEGPVTVELYEAKVGAELPPACLRRVAHGRRSGVDVGPPSAG